MTNKEQISAPVQQINLGEGIVVEFRRGWFESLLTEPTGIHAWLRRKIASGSFWVVALKGLPEDEYTKERVISPLFPELAPANDIMRSKGKQAARIELLTQRFALIPDFEEQERSIFDGDE